MPEHHINVSRTARYYTLGEVNDHLREIWFVLHGYGHLAGRFIREFRSLDDRTRLIVAPEALSRFYLNGSNGHVGASWMTREDRITEISDYLIFLDTLYFHIIEGIDRKKVGVHLLGFSQGTATASRWACLGGVRPDALTLWGGSIAADLDLLHHAPLLRSLRLSMVHGTADPYLNAAAVAEQERMLAEHDIPCRWIRFEGGHEIAEETLKSELLT
jgi:predicted esterase